MFVNVAPKYDQARLIKNLRRDRSLIRPITPKIKTFGRRIGKNVVISVIKIWEFNLGSDPHRQKRWNERQIFLRDLLRRQRSWLGERTVEINDCQRRLRGKNAAFGDDLVTFRLHRRRMRFWQFHASLDRGACRKRHGKQRKNRVTPKQSAQTHFIASLAGVSSDEKSLR